MRAVLFDLDDTLYRELDFVESGLAAVAHEISQRFGVAGAREALDASLREHGRGRTIDHALRRLGIDAPELVPQLVDVYRRHRPSLVLAPDAERALSRLHGRVALGVITDGDPEVQRSKVRALGLSRWIAAMRFTWDDGPEHQKPHPRAYRPVLAALGVAAHEAAYVGDDPHKDFVGARALGLRTVRVLRGRHRALLALPGHQADIEIESLDRLEHALSGA